MFKQMIKNLGADKDYPPRMIMIDLYTRVLEGRLYEHLQYPFSTEYDSQGNYIQLRDRRPSAPYNICSLVVDDSVSLTFGSDHFPAIVCENKEKQKFCEELIEETYLNLKMIEGATAGSVGSVVFLMRILEGKVFWEIKNTQYLTPIYSKVDPSKLIKLVEKYKVKGRDLKALGYSIKDEKKFYWFLREWDENSEVFYLPFEVSNKEAKPIVDKDKTFLHGLGFVPAIWIKNLPKPNSIDGYCTFEKAIPINIEIDYQLSQGGRGLKYSSDPTTVFKLDDSMEFNDNNAVGIAESGAIYLPDGTSATIEGFPMGSTGKRVVRSANNALVLGKDDDAKMLEISGDASRAVLDYVRVLREFGLESIHGNRSNADKVNAAQSGKAMQAMNQALIWLSDKLRITYGQCGLVLLLEMAINASHVYELDVNGMKYKAIDKNTKIKLKWPHWYPNTPDDKVLIANALKTLSDTQHISNETAVRTVASDYAIDDIAQEQAKIKKDQEDLMAQAPKVSKVIQS